MRNYSALFKLFAYDKPDKTGTILQTIGKIGFTVCIIVVASDIFTSRAQTANSLISVIQTGLFTVGFIVGISMLLATGIHYAARDGKTGFVYTMLKMLKNTFLFFLLPIAIITTILVIWAIITQQPAFR